MQDFFCWGGGGGGGGILVSDSILGQDIGICILCGLLHVVVFVFRYFDLYIRITLRLI